MAFWNAPLDVEDQAAGHRVFLEMRVALEVE